MKLSSKQPSGRHFRLSRSSLPALIAVVVIGLIYYIISILAQTPPSVDEINQHRDTSYQAYRQGKFKEAVPDLKTYLKERPADNEARNILVSCYAQLGELDAALSETEELLKARPTDTDAVYRAGQFAASLRRYKTAVNHFKRAIELKPDTVQFHYRLAEVYTELKDFDKALDEWEEVLKLIPHKDPYGSIIYGKIGDIYKAQGNSVRARQAYETGLTINPKDGNLKSKLPKVK